MSRLLIVSNRLPITVKLERGEPVVTRSAGGLATGLRGPHEHGESLWIGWPGDVSRLDKRQRATVDEHLRALRTVPVILTAAETARYYEGFSNGVIWPLFHYMTDKVERDASRDWKSYWAVNERFARAAAEQYRPGDVIWVHDYQLALVPAMIREIVPEARIGFFLHIPFPSSEVFRILPWRAELLEGLLGADLIGFHTYSYLRHFASSVLYVLGVPSSKDRIQYSGRELQLGVFPMGIDAGRFASLAETPEVRSRVEKIRRESKGRKLILGIDRLDYTKGLPRRFLAFERLLEKRPALSSSVRMVQVVVPSRTRVKSYSEYRSRLNEVVGRVNGAHGTTGAVPIHYLYRSIPDEQLVALYSAADVMLVTPLRDGMNLVAKEFVASRIDDGGVLVLSEFAGAAAELAEALLVNPFDIDGVASAIDRALTMPAAEQQARMVALRRRVAAGDAFRWADSFIETLQSVRPSTVPAVSITPQAEVERLAAAAAAAPHLTLLLDYDGTLVPFANAPQLAMPDNDLLTLLAELSATDRIEVHIVSGRTRETLEQWFGHLDVGLHAEHGFWSRLGFGADWQPWTDETPEWKDQGHGIMERYTSATPGSLMEGKTASIAWHYRMADPSFGTSQAESLESSLKKELHQYPVEVLHGEKVVELRTHGVNKGLIVSRLLETGRTDTRFLALGDDRTDEDMFAALPQNSWSVHVGPGASRAAYRLANHAAARGFLRNLAARITAGREAQGAKTAEA